MTGYSGTGFVGGAVALGLLAVPVAGASPPHPEGEDEEPPKELHHAEAAHHPAAEEEDAHHREPMNLFGLKLIGLTAIERADLPHFGENMHFGAGLFYERALVHGMLDVEVTALVCRGREATVMPLELLVKKPFVPAPALTLYVGVGPTLDVVIVDGEREAFPALMAVAGGYVWANSHLGFDFEVSAGHLFEKNGLSEYVFATGPVARF